MKSNDTNVATYTQSKESKRIVTEISLFERSYLEVTTIRITTLTVNEINAETNKVVAQISKTENREILSVEKVPLAEISLQQLRQLRKTKIPSFVLKQQIDGKTHYWFAKIDPQLSFLSSDIIGEHQCSLAPDCCARLSAASDEDGGCSKVRHKARWIERYPFITFGYETFNTHCNTFMVAECTHYIPAVRRPRKTPHEVLVMKMNIAEYIYDDPDALYKLRKQREKNGG